MWYHTSMALDNLSLNIITEELKSQMISTKLGKPFYLGENSYAFPYSKKENEVITHGSFVFRLEPTNPFVCYTKERFDKVNETSPFFNSLKKLTNGTVTGIEKFQGERILTLHIQSDKSDITETNDSYDFILELFPNRPNCYIIAYPYEKIISLYKEHTDLEKGIFLARNTTYHYPEPKEKLPLSLQDPEEARPYLPNATLRYLKSYVNELHHDLNDTLLKMSESKEIYVNKKDILSFDFGLPDAKKVKVEDLYHHFVSNQKEIAKLDKIKELLHLIQHSLKVAEKKKINLHNDLKTAEKRMSYLEYGQMIYLYQSEIKKGDKILERDGYTIPLNPKLDAIKNANFYFKKYSKAKSAIKILNEIIVKTENEIEYLKQKENEVQYGTPRDLMELKSELLEEGYIKEKQGRNTVYKVSKKHRYDPHILLLAGGKIGFGMNGLQNEELTFNLAKKENIFLHIKDYPGSHVVILEGENNQEVFLCALELVLYLSKLDSAEVMVAKKKDVKKNPGHIGLVNILKYETKIVKRIRPESRALFDKELKRS